MSDYNYPEDEFDVSEDEGPVPVGVHRAQAPRWRSWLPLLAVIIIVPVLAWGAVTLLDRQTSSDSAEPAVSQPADGGANGSGDGAEPGGQDNAPAGEPSAGSASPTATGQADLTLGVTVLNGTETSGLAGRTGDRLTNAGFSGVEVPQGIYGEAEPSSSTVFYGRPEQRATAEEIAKQLGISNVVEDAGTAQSTPIVVILREDFQE